LRAIVESGARALFGRGSINRTSYLSTELYDNIDLALSELERLHQTWSSPLLEIGSEVHSLHRVEEDLLKAVKNWARDKGTHFGMHVAWNLDVAAHPVERFGRPLMLLLEDWDLLDDRFIAFHPVRVSDEEIAAMARSGCGAVYCPTSNAMSPGGTLPVPRLLAADIRLGIGLDQPNDGHNFFEVMKNTILHQRVSGTDEGFGSPELALELATLGGARALHREHQIGSLEAGKAADVLVLDGRTTTFAPFIGSLSNAVLAAGPRDVEHVFVDGKQVVKGGRHVHWDEHETTRELNRVMRDVVRRAGLGSETWPVTRWPVI
jgi:5-methylthioadenosine/S-adenosylhomocysteine deaminase